MKKIFPPKKNSIKRLTKQLNLKRRSFNTGLAAAVSELVGLPSLARAKPKIVVVGGGVGGSTVATELKRLLPLCDITLIEPLKEYTSCFFSNTYIGGLHPINHLTHNYQGIEALGIKVIHQRVKFLDIIKKQIHLQDHSIFSYDRLVLSPGIDFIWKMIEGYNEETTQQMPHAWRGRKQTQLLRQLIERMENGGTVIITVPKLPYRCPPAPYERACLIANYFSQYKPKSKIIILDANFKITKQNAFMEIFQKKYSSYVECFLSNDIDDFSLERIDARTNTVITKSGLHLSGSVINVIPPQKAGEIALNAGFGDKNWCSVDPVNFKSRKSKDVYIIGDSSKADQMPKSAYSAFSQGLIVAADISDEVQGRPVTLKKYKNICWSILEKDNAIKIETEYSPEFMNSPNRILLPINSFVSEAGENREVRKAAYNEALGWYRTLTSTIFNKGLVD